MERDELLKKYRALLPERVHALIESSEDGLWARLSSADGRLSNCYTQATNVTELLPMINDAVATFFEIPEEYRAEIGYYTPLSDSHVSLEQMFNQLVAIEKQTNSTGESKTELSLKGAELQVC